MHLVPEHLPLNDKAPSTDAEWEEALKLFGVDRDDPLHSSSPSSSSRPCERHRPLIPRRGMEGSDDSEAEDIDPSVSMRARKKKAFGVGGMISSPPLCNKTDMDQWDGAAERRRMRATYDEQGWLPGCLPSFTTKRRRRRVIRRLGLAGDAEADHERRTIIAHYMDLAQSPDAEPIHHSLESTALSTFAVQTHSECTIIGDLSKDWRTRDNQFLKDKGGKFIAAAPLLYPRSNPPIAFGCLVIVSKQPRTKFSEREQSILLRISSMLVYQLATFQSEVLAEKASVHYEHSLSFFRRAVTTSTPKHNNPTPRSKTRPDLKTRRSKRDKVAEIAIAESDRSDGPPSPLDSTESGEAQLPPFVVKLGPKDQLDAHRASHSSNADLYLDAATTLRSILEADALALIDMSAFNLYYRRIGSDALELDTPMVDPAHRNPLKQFLSGEGWPEELQPVVHHVPSSTSAKTQLLASSSSNPSDTFDLDVGSSTTISELLVDYLKHRQFWWDREVQADSLGARLMALCPTSAQTLLVHFMPTADGRIQHLALATWNRPPSSSALSYPFVQILGGLSTAALNLRKTRTDEARQISYGNIQSHEMRTPLHQILAITQLLRSTMSDLAETQPNCGSYMSSLQQIRDLIPMVNAIDTSSNTLLGIVTNVLAYLDLKSRDAVVTPDSPRAFDGASGGAKPLLEMLEEVLTEAHADAERSRRSSMQSINTIETLLEIVPPELGTAFTEDVDGSIRRVLSRVLSNAYRFIDGEGCVQVKLSHLAGEETLKGCSGLCSTTKLLIEVIDNGPGMDGGFVRDHLGEAWSKADGFTSGSGLSVHLAFRIIDMMGGRMEVKSALGRGCLVRLEVPVPRRKPVMGLDADTPLSTGPTTESARRKIAIVGFNVPNREKTGLHRLGDLLRDQYIAQGADIVDVSEANLVIANGEVEEVAQGRSLMESSAGEIVFLTMPDHQPHPEVISAAERHSKTVRRIPKPITPSVIRQTLAPARPSRTRTRHVRYSSIDGEATFTPSLSSGSSFSRLKGDDPAAPPIPTRPSAARTATSGSWRPKGMCIEEAVATLALGDYFSSTRRSELHRTSSRTSTEGEQSTPATSHSGVFEEPSVEGTPATSVGMAEEISVLESPLQDLETVKVLVVEDNGLNRAILVKIVSKLPVEIVQAVDGVEAVEQFTAMRGRCVVLLDINMPRLDGFGACKEMRALEAAEPWRGHAEIIAVTALSAEDEKRRGRDVGFDDWAVKPCSRAVITKLVETARKKLLGIVDEADPESDRRYTI